MQYSQVNQIVNLVSTDTKYQPKFTYALTKARLELIKFSKEIEDKRSATFTDDVKAYVTNRENLIREHLEKDAEGTPVSIPGAPGQFKLASVKDFNLAVIKFDSDNEEVKLKFETQEKAFTDFLESEVKISKWKLKLSDLPESISSNDLVLLMEVLDIQED
jgi:hypothetical protein